MTSREGKSLEGKWRVFNDSTGEDPGFAIYSDIGDGKLSYHLYSEPEEKEGFLIDEGIVEPEAPGGTRYTYRSTHQHPQGEGVLLLEGSRWTWQHTGGDELHQGHLEEGWGADRRKRGNLRIEDWRLSNDVPSLGYAWNQESDLRLENNSWSKSRIRWEIEQTGEGGELSAGNARVLHYSEPVEITIELINLASEAVGVFVRRRRRPRGAGAPARRSEAW